MADTTKVPGEVRTDFGKGYARRIRQADKIPAVIYGAGHDPVHVSLPGHDMMLISRNANAVIEVMADDGQQHLAMLKPYHPCLPPQSFSTKTILRSQIPVLKINPSRAHRRRL